MHRYRVIAAVSVVMALVLGGFWFRSVGPDGLTILPPCMFHRLTGLACPGCGMTRATHALLNGRIAEAMIFHPIGVLSLPVLGAIVAALAPSWIRGKRPLPLPGIDARIGYGAFGLVLGFWVMRNFPWWPFTWLGPP